MTHPAFARLSTLIRMASEGCSDAEIAEALQCPRSHVASARYVLDVASGQSVRSKIIKSRIKQGHAHGAIAQTFGLAVSTVERRARAMASRHNNQEATHG